jgi:hypothetical protein
MPPLFSSPCAADSMEASMSLFSSIMRRVFGGASAAQPAAEVDPQARARTQIVPPLPAPVDAPAELAPSVTAEAPPVNAPVDVEAVLSDLAAQKGGGGNWRSSIVDLLKLLDLDSSLAARHQLAEELQVHAGADGSAEQNMALSRAVWQQLAAHGGQVPESLRG